MATKAQRRSFSGKIRRIHRYFTAEIEKLRLGGDIDDYDVLEAAFSWLRARKGLSADEADRVAEAFPEPGEYSHRCRLCWPKSEGVMGSSDDSSEESSDSDGERSEAPDDTGTSPPRSWDRVTTG